MKAFNIPPSRDARRIVHLVGLALRGLRKLKDFNILINSLNDIAEWINWMVSIWWKLWRLMSYKWFEVRGQPQKSKHPFTLSCQIKCQFYKHKIDNPNRLTIKTTSWLFISNNAIHAPLGTMHLWRSHGRGVGESWNLPHVCRFYCF